MRLDEIMTRSFPFIRPEVTLTEATEKLKAHPAGALPVCEGDRFRGLLTDRDLSQRVQGYDPATTRVGDVISAEGPYCFADQDVEQAFGVMEEKQIECLPILDQEKRLVGIVTRDDLALYRGGERGAERTSEWWEEGLDYDVF